MAEVTAENSCSYFGKCGGCSYLDLDYDVQISKKKKDIEKTLGIKNILTFYKNSFNYRNRMDFIVFVKMDGTVGVGLRKKDDWRTIVDIEECKIADEKINFALKSVREFFKTIDSKDVFDIRTHIGIYRFVVIRTSSFGTGISFVLNKDSDEIYLAKEKISGFADNSHIENVAIAYVKSNAEFSISNDYEVIKGSEFLNQNYLDRKFFYHCQGFFQNNHQMAIEMQTYVRELLEKYETEDAHLLDLFGGVGTFGIVNSDKFKSVLIVENCKESIDCANKNISENKIENAKAIVYDAMKLSELNEIELMRPLYVITDPPRAGMHKKTVVCLNKLKPKVIVYVSCNPESLAVDLLRFEGYNIKSAAMFDLFPNTPHVEAIVELVLN